MLNKAFETVYDWAVALGMDGVAVIFGELTIFTVCGMLNKWSKTNKQTIYISHKVNVYQH